MISITKQSKHITSLLTIVHACGKMRIFRTIIGIFQRKKGRYVPTNKYHVPVTVIWCVVPSILVFSLYVPVANRAKTSFALAGMLQKCKQYCGKFIAFAGGSSKLNVNESITYSHTDRVDTKRHTFDKRQAKQLSSWAVKRQSVRIVGPTALLLTADEIVVT